MSTVTMGASGVRVGSLDPMTPECLTVARRRRETGDVVTLDLLSPRPAAHRPGQFNMLYHFGVGEVPVSVSGDLAVTERVVHTIRAVGAVSRALSELKRGDTVGIRGPFGTSWPVDEARGADVLIVAGGIGLAPLRPVIYHLLRNRSAYGRIALAYGSRSPEDLLYRRELDRWRRTPDFQVRVTVDRAQKDWPGDVGVVTALLPKLRLDPAETVAMVCGPEIMIRFTTLALEQGGVARERIFLSMERSMKCAIGLCGHCQLGPHFVCRDGAVFRLDAVRELLELREI